MWPAVPACALLPLRKTVSWEGRKEEGGDGVVKPLFCLGEEKLMPKQSERTAEEGRDPTPFKVAIEELPSKLEPAAGWPAAAGRPGKRGHRCREDGVIRRALAAAIAEALALPSTFLEPEARRSRALRPWQVARHRNSPKEQLVERERDGRSFLLFSSSVFLKGAAVPAGSAATEVQHQVVLPP